MGKLRDLLSNEDWDTQIRRVPWLVNIVRITIAITLLMFYLISKYASDTTVRDMIVPFQFYAWFIAYVGLIIATVFFPKWQYQGTARPTMVAMADISMIMLWVYFAGGISSGFAVLVVLFVATSCLMNDGRYFWVYAGYTILLIGVVLFLKNHFSLDFSEIPDRELSSAAMLSIAVIMVSGLTAAAATYLKNITEKAYKDQITIDRLNHLNSLVLFKMQEAVVILDDKERVWLFNRQAKVLFPNLEIGKFNNTFKDIIKRWREAPANNIKTKITLYQHTMQVRAEPMLENKKRLLMLFIRSQREIDAEAQKVKLAAMGMLVANLAHEVRNPLSAIRQANSYMQDIDEEGYNAKFYNIIEKNIQRIDKMLEDISALNKKDRLKTEPISMSVFWQLFKQEFILANPDAKGRISMVSETRLRVLADSHHLQQILWNLCNNAWRHSQKDFNAIKIQVKQIDAHTISIAVIDNGPGVPQKNRPHLFEPFFTTENNNGGTGLGLYVASELASANAGQLDYRPDLNGFELTLPIAHEFN